MVFGVALSLMCASALLCVAGALVPAGGGRDNLAGAGEGKGDRGLTTDSGRVYYSTESTGCGGGGECMPIERCPTLLALLRKPDRTPAEVAALRAAHCGYAGTAPKVCCSGRGPAPQPEPQPQPADEDSCATPDGQIGRCVNLYTCPHLMQMLTPKPVPPEAVRFVQNSRCESGDQHSVCCGPTPPPATVQPAGYGECAPGAAPPDPRGGCCGRDPAGGNRITGGNATGVDQYPWLALIEYRRERLKLLCGGALISGRYVLTAAHCVTGYVLTVGTPVNVRLGEYDTSNELTEQDCATVEGGGRDCAEPPLVIPIERTIPHPQYNAKDSARKNDIALVRMKYTAPYTDFIRPICLPTVDLTLAPPENFTLFAAGWGAINATVLKSDVKMHVDLPFQPLQECQAVYSRVKQGLQLWSRQVCAGGVKGKDSCSGDSGGPLMFENGRTFEVIGVVSFGPTPCGLERVPGVYSKVYEYNAWIRSQIRP